MPEATLEKNKEHAMTQTPCREEVFFPPEHSPIVPSSDIRPPFLQRGAVTLMNAQQHQSFCNYPHPTHFPSFLPSFLRLPSSHSNLSAPPLANPQVARITNSPPLGMYRTAQYDRTMPVVCHAQPRRIERALPPDAPTSGSVLSYPPHLGIPVCYAWRACM
ncbi:hypothetical protein B9Z19DRAFT_1080139 [Tuber borchii]|uniref:Uncharacterized protein n=1 Tax=Tuber borchii TaxID=42251 RepID=A0A2T6ZXH4_TUBBO|nr:hypothetical protein B9Z19DRAFT_1080139 [Tuber borchii]